MPRPHSATFQKWVTTNEIPVKLDIRLFQDPELSYEAMSDLLRETNDAQFGIVSTLNKDNEWVRDATRSIPLANRMPHDAPIIEANNVLLRCLSRLRPIDYALRKKLGSDAERTTQELKSKFGVISQNILEIGQDNALSDKDKLQKIKELEREFNVFLVEKLHEADLTAGCNNEADAEKLLFHYRNLSSLLTPARTMITLTYDEPAGIFQRETQYPVTEKTEAQKKALKELETVTPYPFKDEKNSHTSHKPAMQEADSLFAELIASNNTALSAQARKTHLVGAKNAFVVKNEIIELAALGKPADMDALQATKDNTLWLARMGSPVFVGKGADTETLDLHTRENLDQVRFTAQRKMAAGKLNLHVTSLNTDSPLENQHTIVTGVTNATRGRKAGDNVSYIPVNPDGTFRLMDVAPGLQFKEGTSRPTGTAPLMKATRLESVATVMLAAANTEDTLSIVHCASGQDRTGTAVEKATQNWMEQRYKSLGKEPGGIEDMRACGGNAAEITTHHIQGSPGMKLESKANNLFGLGKDTFSPEANKQFYLKSASTNKKNEVNKDQVGFLKEPNERAVTEFERNLLSFTTALTTEKTKGSAGDEKKKKFLEKGDEILKHVSDIAGEHPNKLSPRSLYDLNQVLVVANKCLNEMDDPKQTAANAKRLGALSHHISGKSSPGWKKLGGTLLVFACAALVVVGVLAAIPSGGSSLLLAAVGVAGLAATAGIGSGVALAGIGGAAAMYHGQEKKLAKSVGLFKKELEALNPKETAAEEFKKPVP